MESNNQKQHYIVNSGKKIPISRDVYVALCQNKDHIRMIAKLEGRCRENNYKHCTGDCWRCCSQSSGIIMSIDDEELDRSLFPVDYATPEEIFMQKETWNTVYKLADRCANHGNTLIRLYFQEGKSIHEISSILDISYSTVRDQMHRIISFLKENKKYF